MKALCTTGLLCLLFFAIFTSAQAQTWTSYTSENSGLASNRVMAIALDNNNIKWFGTANGLSRFDGKNWTTYTTAHKLAHNTITALAYEVTSYGSELWIGTNGGGVSVVSISKPDAITAATPYTPDNTGLASLTVYTAAVDTGHVKWFGTDKGVSTFSGTEWATYTTDNQLSNNVVKAIAAAGDGWVYLGTDGGGVSRYDGVTYASPYDTMWSEILSDAINAAFVDSKGAQWFGTDAGVSVHAGHDTRLAWTAYTTKDGLVDNAVTAIIEDTRGFMWFGTRAGVSSFDGGRWTAYTTADGLAGNVVNAIAVDREGALWFGTDSGVSRFGGEITTVGSSEELPSIITINGIYPNPFNPSTTISFTLPSDSSVRVDIYALSGQKVRTLVSRDLSAGIHSVVWNGRDSRGKAAASGVYLVRLTMDGITASQRMSLVK